MNEWRKVKLLLVGSLLLAVLVSCTIPIGPYFCDIEETICVKLIVAEPIKPAEPVSITVISGREFSELFVFLSVYPPGEVSIDEEPGEPSPKQGVVKWTSSVHVPRLTFMRKIHLPLIEGEYIPGQSGGYDLIDLQASAWIEGLTPVSDCLTIFVTSQGGKVYYCDEGPIPITPGPLPIVTLSPTPTFIPTFTFIPTPTSYLFPNP